MSLALNPRCWSLPILWDEIDQNSDPSDPPICASHLIMSLFTDFVEASPHMT